MKFDANIYDEGGFQFLTIYGSIVNRVSAFGFYMNAILIP